jgi:hypothetical protein
MFEKIKEYCSSTKADILKSKDEVISNFNYAKKTTSEYLDYVAESASSIACRFQVDEVQKLRHEIHALSTSDPFQRYVSQPIHLHTLKFSEYFHLKLPVLSTFCNSHQALATTIAALFLAIPVFC